MGGLYKINKDIMLGSPVSCYPRGYPSPWGPRVLGVGDFTPWGAFGFAGVCGIFRITVPPSKDVTDGLLNDKIYFSGFPCILFGCTEKQRDSKLWSSKRFRDGECGDQNHYS